MEKGELYKKTVVEVNEIFDYHLKSGLSNRRIWKEFIYPKYGISERTLYNHIKASANPEIIEYKKQLEANRCNPSPQQF